MRVLVFRKDDIKADGFTLKKKNNSKEFDTEQFKQYVKDNNLSLSYGYSDSRGDISNGSMFKCYLLTDIGTHIPVGVSGLIKEIKEVD